MITKSGVNERKLIFCQNNNNNNNNTGAGSKGASEPGDRGQQTYGTTLLPWARGKPLAWDVTVPDTYAESHINDTMTSPGLAADQAAQQNKYSKLLSTYIFCPVAVETAGSWNGHRTCSGD